MGEGINVLSLFDGMSCGQIALERAGIKVKNYFASEIDKHAIAVTMQNYPNTIQIGDVTKVKAEDLPKIDLLIGGSPCQSFSRAGDGSGFDGKSKLFFEYVRLLKEINPKYFILENVVMKQEWQDIISKNLGVFPRKINSSKVSAQNRNRLYWTNIEFGMPEDSNIKLESVICIGAKGAAMRNQVTKEGIKPFLNIRKDDKSNCIVSSFSKKLNGVVVNNEYRPLIPEECEKLQTVPLGYTRFVTTTQRYKMLGNGWTVDVIAHILRSANF